MKVGILALQGAVKAHAEKIIECGAEPVFVREASHFDGIAGIIIPGGESSTMLKLLDKKNLWDELKVFCESRPSWGICAGCILLAKKVSAPKQKSLDILDVSVKRNAFGRQLESFITPITSQDHSALPNSLEGVFIRAPKIETTASTVRTLYKFQNEPVMVESELTLASTFHPELSAGSQLHQHFLEKIIKLS